MVFDKITLNRLYRYSLSLTHHPDQAYDLMQTAIEKYLHSQNERESTNTAQPENPTAYLYRIIRNAFIDSTRRQKNRKHEEWEDHVHARIDPTEFDRSLGSLERILIDREQVEHILSLLTEEQRELLFLWAVEGYTIQEIADFTHTPKGTLLARVYRLRQKLLQILPEEYTSHLPKSPEDP